MLKGFSRSTWIWQGKRADVVRRQVSQGLICNYQNLKINYKYSMKIFHNNSMIPIIDKKKTHQLNSEPRDNRMN